MSDYIKRKKAVNAIADMLAFVANGEFSNRFRRSDFVDDAEEWLEDVKPEDVAPVRHGHWDVREPMPMHDIKGNLSWGNWYVCTGCGFATTAIEGHITQYKYCPNCGARMDGEDDE